jgi:hypothetical protein
LTTIVADDAGLKPGLREERTFVRRKLLLGCGVLSSLVYIALDLVPARRYQGYSVRDQAVSELNATGAPTRRLFLSIAGPYNVLLSALSLGVAASGGGTRDARLTGMSLLASAVVGTATPLFFPMDRRGDAATRRGRMHPPMTSLGSALILSSMGFGARMLGPQFRSYSYWTIASLIVFGLMTALYAPRLAAGQATPGMGLVERANIYAYLLWVAVLAVALWDADRQVVGNGG